MNITKIDLSHYNLKVIGYEETNDIMMSPPRWFALKLCADNPGVEPFMDDLLDDMQLMNKIRFNSDPAVEEAFKQLLTVMALTK